MVIVIKTQEIVNVVMVIGEINVNIIAQIVLQINVKKKVENVKLVVM